MSSLRNIRSDIMLILQKSKLSVDSRLYKKHIEFLIHKYRAAYAYKDFLKTGEIDDDFLQDLGVLVLSPVNSGDDPLVPFTSLQLGKLTLPPTVALPENKGVYRIANASKLTEYYPIKMPRFFELVPGSVLANFDYYFVVNNQLFVKYCRDLINPVLVLLNPMDGFIMNSEYISSGNLIVGQSYTVYNAQVIYNGTPYLPGNTFIVVNGVLIFTGIGQVKLTNMKRAMTLDDPYPIPSHLGAVIAMDILTKEFQIEPQEIGNMKNESQDQLTVLKNA